MVDMMLCIVGDVRSRSNSYLRNLTTKRKRVDDFELRYILLYFEREDDRCPSLDYFAIFEPSDFFSS